MTEIEESITLNSFYTQTYSKSQERSSSGYCILHSKFTWLARRKAWMIVILKVMIAGVTPFPEADPTHAHSSFSITWGGNDRFSVKDIDWLGGSPSA